MAKVNTDTYTGASFSFQNKVARLVWSLVYTFLFRYSPRPLHSWRSFLLRLFGAKIGKGVHIYPKVKIWAPWNLIVHDMAGVGDGVILYNQGKITLGEKSIVSQGSHLCSGTHDYTKWGHPLITAPITIGKYAWITAECFIHPGVNIGEGAIIGARSVVNRDMPDRMICAGHPCKPLKERIMEDAN